MRFLRLLPVPFLLATAQAALRAPYAADAATLHLYQFEEASGATASANLGSAARSVFAVSLATATALPPTVTTVLGAAGAPGFGSAADLSGAGQLLGYDGNGSGAYRADVSAASLSTDRVALSTLGVGGTAPFTLEALVRPGTSSGAREIISTDSSAGTRGFQFRINNSGTTQFLDFNLIGAGQQFTATLPSSGPHAYATGTWFHVAFVYDGAQVRFYWTALDAVYTAANPVGTPQTVALSTSAASIEGPLTLGNENRNNAGESLAGLLDQVRISSVARSPSEFVFGITDSDSDELPDDWETAHFGDLDETAGGDYDSDGLTNLQEYLAGSDPTVPNDPDDTDADGLPDEWEQTHFGSLAQTPTADPDGDGSSNADEFAAGSVPRNRASTPADTDADGLPDTWEQSQFATLAYNAGDDSDGDRFSNFQEYAASTSPIDPLSRPAGTPVKLVPVDDGDAATSEFGYAGSSAINSVAFVRCSLQTFGGQQFMTWYGRHQYDSAAAYNNTLWIGRRTLGSSHWEVFRHPTFTANTITDGHDVISFGIDGEGYMHLSWGMHGDAFHYSKSTAPVTGSAPIVLGPDLTMTGTESQVTYPQFLRLPDGDLLFLFREVASGNGDTYVNRYDLATHAWANVHGSASTQSPFIKGTGWSPNYNAYLNMPQLGGPDGDDLILTWCWRFSSGTSDSGSGASGYQTNNRLNFARSPDAGLTWQHFDGTPYNLPITRDGEAGAGTTAEVIHDIPENYSLINQASTCLDSAGNPVTATWWAPETGTGNRRRQYMVVFRHDNGTWQARAVSSRVTDPAGTRYAENHVRDLGRPTVVRDDADRIIVAYRDNQASNLTNADASLSTGVSNGITIVHSLPKAQDPDRLLWISFNLTSENLGNYETMIDNELWDQRRQLHFLYQPSEGQGFTAPANLAARISVLEWDAADYFNHSPQPGIESAADGAGVRIHWRSEPSFTYRLLTSTDLVDWTEVETRTGTGAVFEHVHTLVPGEPKRFWRLDRTEGGF